MRSLVVLTTFSAFGIFDSFSFPSSFVFPFKSQFTPPSRPRRFPKKDRPLHILLDPCPQTGVRVERLPPALLYTPFISDFFSC